MRFFNRVLLSQTRQEEAADRIIRLMALFVALLTPSLYISVSTFHEEMIQTDLLLAIAATRERMPFPALLEVLIMEVAFELLREAGVRIPTAIGPTIGVVGALILGQAAVDANIISPILVHHSRHHRTILIRDPGAELQFRSKDFTFRHTAGRGLHGLFWNRLVFNGAPCLFGFPEVV